MTLDEKTLETRQTGCVGWLDEKVTDGKMTSADIVPVDHSVDDFLLGTGTAFVGYLWAWNIGLVYFLKKRGFPLLEEEKILPRQRFLSYCGGNVVGTGLALAAEIVVAGTAITSGAAVLYVGCKIATNAAGYAYHRVRQR